MLTYNSKVIEQLFYRSRQIGHEREGGKYQKGIPSSSDRREQRKACDLSTFWMVKSSATASLSLQIAIGHVSMHCIKILAKKYGWIY